jgi:AAA15 family ATPase/GTPase
MITKISITNFKKLEKVNFNTSQSVVIIGPNNSGKTTVFQALCLWEIGVTNYISAYKKNDLNRQGYIVINRKDLLNSPISDARFLWRDKNVTEYINKKVNHIRLIVEIEGDTNGKKWICKTEFIFSNAESFTCRIKSGLQDMIDLYENQSGIHFCFLQPMSGISTTEDKLTQGSIDRKLGEGKTAEVLRNICFEILNPEIQRDETYNSQESWEKLCKAIKIMFGAELQQPEFIKSTGLIQLEYIENNIKYDISSAGRGFQQTLLLFAYMYANQNTILLLDEPDAHLEVIRQRQVFQMISETANDVNSQLFIASHSEVVLAEAADSSKVIALIENNAIELNSSTNSQTVKAIRKSLTEIGWEKYYLAKSKRHILFLEGSTDLEMLKEFAIKLDHKTLPLLRSANVQYTSDNVPTTAINMFSAIKELFPELKGLAVFDFLPNLQSNPKLNMVCWKKRELENYFAKPDLLIELASILSYKRFKHTTQEELLKTRKLMKETINDITPPIYLKDLAHEWWNKTKLTDEWLDIIIAEFYKKIGKTQDFYKRDYYELIKLMKPSDIDIEITEKLDLIYETIK